ncbi:hypothetical protein LshimejAT787_1301600 [Lyophyllum shimeji]|uniref:NTF2 domain-containing protein n=1 Tax=Lyophyllum shimeji TaxID=47721 RepID=A0A9P3PXF6_LYOSH|nr:hypothetical protein LshimejAT787_1301600 [Lyophyllum shimeji]
MRPASTSHDRRPEVIRGLAASAANVHREDAQPNEAINKRQRVQPPSVIPVSLPPPGRGHRARDPPASDSAATVQRSRSGWTQYAVRGNKAWRGARGGRGGRGTGQELRRIPSYHERPASTTSDHTSDTASHQDDRRLRTPADLPLPTAYLTLGRYPYQTYSTRPTDMTAVPPLPAQQQPGMNDGKTGLRSPATDYPSNMATNFARGTHPFGTPDTNVTPRRPLPARTERETDYRQFSGSLLPQATTSSTSTEISPPQKRRRLDRTPSPHIKSEDVEAQAIPSAADRRRTPSLPPTIKPELRSPSPPRRRLITQSCTLYALPDNCRKLNPNPNPDYLKNRNALATKERQVLKRRGLKVEKVMFRDDGMVIEWTSSVPVWSDTLLPESPKPPEKVATAVPKKDAARRSRSRDTDNRPSTSLASSKEQRMLPQCVLLPGQEDRRVDDVRADASTGVISVSASPSPTPPPKDKGKAKEVEIPPPPTRLGPTRRPLPLPKPRALKSVSLAEPRAVQPTRRPLLLPKPRALKPSTPTEAPPDQRHEASSILSNEPSTSHVHLNTAQASIDVVPHVCGVAELEDVEPIAVDYLQRYIRAFDADPSTLQHSYAPYAVFSIRTPAAGTAATLRPAEVCQGPDEIAGRLSLLRQYKFCPAGRGADVVYDVVSLGAAAAGGIFLTTHGAVVDTSVEPRARTLAVDQAFVLQQRAGRGKEGGAGAEDGWPLVAVSHQMVIREIAGGPSFVQTDRRGEYEFPWLV